MWLPGPVYERIPQIWFLSGLLFIANGLYVGIDFPISLVCIAVGLLCCLFGIGLGVFRSRNRHTKPLAAESQPAE